MFRRTTKGSFEDAKTLYDEESSSIRSQFSQHFPKEDHRTDPSGLFEPLQKNSTNRPPHLMATPLSKEKGEEDSIKWSQDKTPEQKSSLPFTKEEPETTLGEGVSFKGELVFEKLLRIDGHFEGKLVSSGKIIVGPTGFVKSDINLSEAIIEGTVEGNITASGKIELRGGAIVLGDISAASLCVDEGVSITGYVCISHPTKSETTEESFTV